MENLFTTRPHDTTSDANAQQFIMRQFLNKHAFITVVRVTKLVTNSKGIVTNVAVRPMVHGFTGAGDKIEQSDIFNVPVWRLQRGSSAVIMNPVVGDIGMIASCDRDISTIKATGAAALPATNRIHSLSDSIYLGGLLNADPEQYVKFTDNSIEVVSPTALRITAPTTSIEGNLTVSGTVTAQGDVTGVGVSLSTHLHGGVQSGNSNTSGPR